MKPLPAFRAVRVVCAVLLAFSAGTASAQPRFDFDTAPGRLAKDVRPSHVALTLTLDPDADRFSGAVTLTLNVRRPVPAILLHAHELQADTAVLLPRGKAPARPLLVEADVQAQTWRLRPADGLPVAAGLQRVRIVYAGRVQRTGSGLFSADHKAFGTPVRMLATQLEAIFARMLFPAFDEPAFRAVFSLSVRAPSGYAVVSNMPAIARTDDGTTAMHRFAPTPPMPSYLFAVAVGRFDALAGRAAGVPLRILTAPGRRDHAAYALGVTQQVLPYYNAYFGVPYALPKLDQLAVPSGRNGAMEDWGLISYAESNLLFDPAKDDNWAQRNIFSLVAHEVAHQWFGNLVTAASWEEIWLNEAFATWMAEKAADHFNPAWQTALRRRQPIDATMVRDAGPATRAIRSGAVQEDRVFDVFDNITYTKGGAVLTMLEQWVGAGAFQRGLAAYMKARRFSNATAGDLWFHIGKAAGRDVAAVAASWTDQPGFPLVGVVSRCVGGKTELALTQQRFSAVAGGAADAALWRIPLLVQHGGRQVPHLFEGPRQTVTLPGCPAQPLLVNPGGEGFYRVAYAPAQHAALAAGFGGLAAPARIALLSDTFALAQGGQLPMALFVELLAAVPQAAGPGRPALFGAVRSSLRFLDAALAGSPAQADLRAAARALLAPELATLGWQPRAGEDSETELLRSALIEDLARYDDAATLAQARRLFDADEAGTTPLHPAVRGSVLDAVGLQADPVRFGQLMARLAAAQSESERWVLLSALCAVRDPTLAAQTLALALQGTVPGNMASWVPGMVAERSPNGALAYRYTLDHWEALTRQAGTMFGATAGLLPGAAAGFNDGDGARRLIEDQQRLLGEPGAASAARAAARIALRAAVREREAARLQSTLQALQARLGGGG